MKIYIELNHVLRDINSQIVKYYKKDINKTFDDADIDIDNINLVDNLKFASKKDKYNFLYIDYPFEIFGCARTKEKNLNTQLTQWISELEEKGDIKVCHFSLLEDALTIQSTYHFLSKIGSRVREIIFPKDGVSLWKYADVIITTNKRIINSTPKNKVVVSIGSGENKDNVLSYAKLTDVFSDNNFLDKINNIINKHTKKTCFSNNIKNKILNFFKK